MKKDWYVGCQILGGPTVLLCLTFPSDLDEVYILFHPCRKGRRVRRGAVFDKSGHTGHGLFFRGDQLASVTFLGTGCLFLAHFSLLHRGASNASVQACCIPSRTSPCGRRLAAPCTGS